MNTPSHALTDVDRAWLAAMIDGEGTIGLYRSKRAKTRSGWRFYPTVSLNNTNKALVDRFSDLTEPWVTRRRDYDNGNGNKHIYNVEIRYAKVGGFLREIYDFLIAKRRQADVVFDFLEIQRDVGQRNFDLIPEFNELYINSRLLNKRGTKDLDTEKLRQDILQDNSVPAPQPITSAMEN